MSPKAVKPHVKGLKNDRNDACGIYNAVVMGVREVPVKPAAVRDLAMLLTMRTKRRKDKVSKINHIRGILAEYGLVTDKSVNAFMANAGSLIRELQKQTNVSPHIISELFDLFEEVKNCISKIEELEKRSKPSQAIANTMNYFNQLRVLVR